MLYNWKFISVCPEVDPICVPIRIAQCKMNTNENKNLCISSKQPHRNFIKPKIFHSLSIHYIFNKHLLNTY